jgi:hypothetical protein
VAFADPIRDLLYKLDPVIKGDHLSDLVDASGWDVVKSEPEVRRLLQRLGNEAGKSVLGENIWVELAREHILSGGYDGVVITDVRFKVELELLHELDAELWRVVRPGVYAVNSHASETELDHEQPDRVLYNGGTLDELRQMVGEYVLDYEGSML